MLPFSRIFMTGFMAFLIFGTLPAGTGFAQSSDQVLATVDGEIITQTDVITAFQRLPPQLQQQGLEAVYPLLLEEIIGRKVMVAKARAAGADRAPEVQDRLRQIEDDIIYNYYVIKQAEGLVSDAQVREAYDAWIAQQPDGEEIKASHILVETEAEAREIIQLVTDGTDFATLAQERSLDTGSATRGGDLGFFGRGQMIESFETAAYALQPNTFTSTPVQSQFGYHIILVTERRAITHPGFEQVAPRFRQQLAEPQVRSVIEAAIGNARVLRFDLNGDPLPAPALDQ